MHDRFQIDCELDCFTAVDNDLFKKPAKEILKEFTFS